MCQSFFRRHLEDTAIHLVSTTRPKKLVSAYLSPTKTLIESDRNECLSGGFLVLMAFEVNENCSVMNSILIRDQNMLLRIYANKNSWLMRWCMQNTMWPQDNRKTLRNPIGYHVGQVW
jgi:hypothetical protein